MLYDELNEIYEMISEQNNLYDSPWSAPSSELLLEKGKNFLWWENLSQIQIKNSTNIKLETTKLSKGEINSQNYTEILNEKFED